MSKKKVVTGDGMLSEREKQELARSSYITVKSIEQLEKIGKAASAMTTTFSSIGRTKITGTQNQTN